jgi:hypothetical protein
VGVVHVSQVGEAGADRLPDGGQVLPSDENRRLQLDQVLYLPTQDETIVTALRPQITDASILQQANFSAVLKEAPTRLCELADQMGDRGTALRNAAAMLEQEWETQELLAMNRAALLQA